MAEVEIVEANTYPLSSYTYEKEEPKIENDSFLDRMRFKFAKEGMRNSVEAILLAHENDHLHLLILKSKDGLFKLPGGRLRPGEDEIEGLKRKLTSKLGGNPPDYVHDWQIGECVAIWWRPSFEPYMYPYHTIKPKECKKLFLVHLPRQGHFKVPENMTMLAVPFSSLYNDVKEFGQIISAIPLQLSRFHFNFVSNEA